MDGGRCGNTFKRCHAARMYGFWNLDMGEYTGWISVGRLTGFSRSTVGALVEDGEKNGRRYDPATVLAAILVVRRIVRSVDEIFEDVFDELRNRRQICRKVKSSSSGRLIQPYVAHEIPALLISSVSGSEIQRLVWTLPLQFSIASRIHTCGKPRPSPETGRPQNDNHAHPCKHFSCDPTTPPSIRSPSLSAPIPSYHIPSRSGFLLRHPTNRCHVRHTQDLRSQAASDSP